MPTRGTLRHSSFLVRYSIFMKQKWARFTLQVVSQDRRFVNHAEKSDLALVLNGKILSNESLASECKRDNVFY